MVYLNLLNSMILYLPKLKHLLTYYINLYRDFYNKIESSYIYFGYKKPKYQLDITKIVLDYKIVKTKLKTNNKTYNNKKYII